MLGGLVMPNRDGGFQILERRVQVSGPDGSEDITDRLVTHLSHHLLTVILDLGVQAFWDRRAGAIYGTSSENLIDRLPRKAISSVPKLANWTPFTFVIDSLL
jgi:hypothetical protein